MKIIEYKKEYENEVKEMLTELQNHIIKIDKYKLNTITPEYKEEYFKFAYNLSYNNEGKFFIAIENNIILGFIACSVTQYEDFAKISYKCPKKGVITELFVKDLARKKGVASLLIKKVEQYLKSISCEYIELDVFASNINAYNLYKKHSFEDRVKVMFKKL